MSRLEDYWQDLGGVAAGGLAQTRVELHRAVHCLSAAAGSFLPEQHGGEHLTLTYLPEAGALSTDRIEAQLPFRFGLSFCAFELVALDADGAFLDKLSLQGQGAASASAWMQQVARRAGRMEAVAFPSIGDGALAADAAAAREIGRYFANSSLLLETPGILPAAPIVRTWPKRFNMSTRLHTTSDRSIVMGFCPGDAAYAEPYWYVAPWPAPEPGQFIVIAEPGHWHAREWQGAVLTASELFERNEMQPALLEGFYRRALILCRGLLT